MRRLVLTAIMMALALAISAPAIAGGGGHGTDRCAGFAEGTEITMLDNCFAGTAHFAPEGRAITIVNDGQFPHSYTAVDGTFDTGILQPGLSSELVFKGPGTFEVFCTLHGSAEGFGMAGVLLVDGSGAPLAATPAVAVPPPAQSMTPELVAALDRQSDAIADLTAQEAALLGRLVSTADEPQGFPAPLTVVLVVAALALAAIFLVTKAPGRDGVGTQVVGRPGHVNT